jgi:SAM-dependent methyltransferase
VEGARPPDWDHLAWLERYHPVTWRDKRVLDLGCGSGFLCAHARGAGATAAVGIDLKDPDVAPEKAGWSFQRVDLDSEGWGKRVAAEGRFDYVFAFDVLEHLASPVRFLAELRDALAPAGRLVLTTPNTSSWERLMRGDRWSGATDPTHRVLFTPYSLRFLLQRSGFRPLKLVAPMRKLEFLGPATPMIGAQIFCAAEVTA